MRTERVLAILALAAFASGCAMLGLGPNVEARYPRVPEGELQAALLPPPGKTLIIIGQSADAPAHEPGGLGPPGGVMMYTGLGADAEQTLQSQLTSDPQSVAIRYPESALQIALNVVGRIDAIAAGSLDADIDRFIGILAATGRPIYLRFGYEFDGEWNHYFPLTFRQAWLRFRSRLVASGAKNIAMVWHSAAFCGGTFGGTPTPAWYPGDDAVDWIGMSWFIPQSCDYSVPRHLIDFARKHRKPVMIAESSPRGYDLAQLRHSWNGKKFESRTAFGIWREWFDPYFDFIKANDDVIKAVSYINDDWDARQRWGPPYRQGYYGNAQLDADSGIARRWRSEMHDRRWLRGGPQLFAELLSR